MMRTKFLIAAAVLTASSVVAVSAKADPVYLGYSLNGGTTVTAFTAAQSSNPSFANPSNGTNSGTFTLPGFSINFQATGTPPLSEPNFSSGTVTATATSFTGPSESIILYASETGLTTVAGSFVTGFTNNSDSTNAVTLSDYKSSTTVATSPFATDRLLSTGTLAQGTSMNNMVAPFGGSAAYSLTETYAITFTGANQFVDATIGVRGTPAAVPEPVSLSLLGFGLAGLGLVRLRRRS